MLKKDTKEGLMLMFVYCGILAVAVVICAFVGYEVDELISSEFGMITGVLLFFVACWLSWVLAVWITEPKSGQLAASDGGTRGWDSDRS
jgi:hypothetical protein